MEALISARRTGGPFRDLFDLCERVDPGQVTRATIETLVKAGAFDTFGGSRAQHMAAVERAIQSGAALHADRKSGQKGLFDALDEPGDDIVQAALPDVPPWDDRQRLAGEREVLGFYLSSHPLAEHERTLSTYCSHSTTDLAALPARSEVVLGGMISAIKYSQTRANNAKYAMFDLEDMAGAVRCIAWPEQFNEYGHLIASDATLVARGSIDRRPGTEEANLIINELIPLADLATRFTKGIVVRVNQQEHGERTLDDLHEILRGYPGSCELQLALWLEDGTRAHLKCEGLRVDLNPEMRSRVDALLGPGNVRLIADPPPQDSRSDVQRVVEMSYGF
jgi:DNA polymerase-3 subunit alpha